MRRGKAQVVPVREFIVARCPRCGGALDVLVQIESIAFTRGDFNQPDIANVVFKDQMVDHECRTATSGEYSKPHE